MRWPWQKPNPLAGRDYLALVPVAQVAHTVDEDGRVTLLAPRFATGLLARLLQPRLPAERRHVRVALEARGSALWPLIDGERPVGDLVARFREAFPDDDDEAVERVCRWVHGVYIHRFIKFIGIDE